MGVRESEVEVLWNHKVVGFIEDPATSQLGRVSLMNSNTGERTIIDVDATFIAIGYAPNTDMFKGQLEMLPGGRGYLTTQGKSTATSVPGVFAAGDVADPTYRQAVTSAGSGAQAALDAERWLSEQPPLPAEALRTDGNAVPRWVRPEDFSEGWTEQEVRAQLEELGLPCPSCAAKADFVGAIRRSWL